MSQPKPLCFVLMPFGKKPDPTGRADIDFDEVYRRAIAPAIEDAGLIPLRSDHAAGGGIIHRKMFAALMLCEYAVADLTSANANVFYELGVRHTARPSTTQAIFAKHHHIPFDVSFLEAVGYDLGANNRFAAREAKALRESLGASLKRLRKLAFSKAHVDSPIFQLIGEWKPPKLARLKTDVFRDELTEHRELQERMAEARLRRGEAGLEALGAVEKELDELDVDEAGVIVELMLSYRALSAWRAMIDLYARMPVALQRQVMVREQLGLALNREAGRLFKEDSESVLARTLRERALSVLKEVESEQGPSSETCGLIGRIHKDLWTEACARGKKGEALAASHLDRAIGAYRRGFQADWRDAYPGINAVTLLEMKGDDAAKAERDRLLPVVRFSAEQRLASGSPDYWDHATMLELAVLASDAPAAERHLGDALASLRAPWEAETTARNLRLIRDARTKRRERTPWLARVIAELEAASR